MIQANTWPKTTRIAGGRDRAIPLVHYGQLSGAEWEIVELARWDGPRSLNPDGLLARLQRILFGAETPRPLANKRLETLRRFSVKAWFWKRLREEDVHALLGAGFSSNDAVRILAHVARHRGFAPSVEIWPA